MASGSPQIKGAKKSALQWVMGSNRSSCWPGVGKQRCRLETKAFEALFIGLMAPTQQLLKMHHTSSVRLTETHAAAQHQPIAGVQRSTEPMITSIEPRIAMMSATFTPFKR